MDGGEDSPSASVCAVDGNFVRGYEIPDAPSPGLSVFNQSHSLESGDEDHTGAPHLLNSNSKSPLLPSSGASKLVGSARPTASKFFATSSLMDCQSEKAVSTGAGGGEDGHQVKVGETVASIPPGRQGQSAEASGRCVYS